MQLPLNNSQYIQYSNGKFFLNHSITPTIKSLVCTWQETQQLSCISLKKSVYFRMRSSAKSSILCLQKIIWQTKLNCAEHIKECITLFSQKKILIVYSDSILNLLMLFFLNLPKTNSVME